MSTSILFALVFIGYSSVSGKMVTLKCPAGYHVKAWPTYNYEKTVYGSVDGEMKKVKKLMFCVRCEPQSRTNDDLEVCHDKDFTEAVRTYRTWAEQDVEARYRHAPLTHSPVRASNQCDNECHGKVCSVAFNTSINKEGEPFVEPLRFNECKEIQDSEDTHVMKG